jgi:lipopolysaccharide/colanic/teichoic acid biosynthesis glycosyltransferase
MKLTTRFASVEGAVQAAARHGPALRALPTSMGTWHMPHADNDVWREGRTSRAEFLRSLHREKRRTDRSHSALSLVLLDIDSSQAGAIDVALEKLDDCVRETDYTAPIDDGRVAVLLPDTGEAGLQTFLAKLAQARVEHVLSVVGATYPDASFDKLVASRLSAPTVRHAADEPPPTHRKPGYPLKRTFDIIGALVALVVLSPLMLGVALAIKLTSPGPVIFRQARIGLGGVPFTFYKFRSMRTDNDDREHREYVARLIDGKLQAPTDGQFKMKADPRVTGIGRLIRKTSIDELPQFYNVLIGDMSLVGPRPPVPYEAERYKGWHRRRVFELKPGLTGIWQVEGRSRVSFDEMVRMDLRYLRRCSLGFDLALLARTAVVVVGCKGAR